MDAPGRDGAETAAVDRDPAAAVPPGREVRLVRRESEDAAAVDRAVRGAVELVGDREAAGRRGGAGAADADARAAQHSSPAPEHERALREVDLDRHRGAS